MLSKNLYEIDEVVAALQLCLRMTWPRAHFWAHELVASEEEELLRTVLRDSWLDYGAPADIRVLMDLQSLVPDSDLVSRVMEAIRTTGSLAPISLFNKGKGRRLRVTPATSDPKVLARRAKGAAAFLAATEFENMDPDHLKAWWISFDSACRCHWFRDAIWLLQAVQPTLSSDGIWAGIMLAARGLSEVKEFIRDLREEGSIRAQAAAVATLCYPSTNLPQSVQPKQVDWSQWSTLSGRGARLYAIPKEALHSQTTRGALSTKYTNIQDIREPVLLLPQGCAYWRRITAVAGFRDLEEGIEVPEDRAYETFCDRHFPDDIPDEWSAADQQKSHGRGLGSTDPLTHSIRSQISENEWAWGIHVPARSKKLTK